MQIVKRWGFAVLALVLAVGWFYREVAIAREQTDQVKAGTINLDRVEMKSAARQGRTCRQARHLSCRRHAGLDQVRHGAVCARARQDAARSSHSSRRRRNLAVIESGHGEILCDGKTTKVGPGSVMFTTPNAEHGINNTGDQPIVFYYVKWEGRK